jgi:hypothetical protein
VKEIALYTNVTGRVLIPDHLYMGEDITHTEIAATKNGFAGIVIFTAARKNHS